MKSNLPELVNQWLAVDETRTQKELARRAKISEGTLSRLMHSNPQRLDLGIAEKLQSVIQFDERDLIIKAEA